MFNKRKCSVYLILCMVIGVSHGLSSLTSSRRKFLSSFVSKSTDSRLICREAFPCSRAEGVSRSKFIRKNFLSNISLILSLGLVEKSNAACLPGDTSADCIGVYKVPLDTNIDEYVSTPEKLKLFAPDLRYVPPVVPPESYKDSIKELIAIYKENIEEKGDRRLRTTILGGNLTEVGVIILGIMPRVTVAGRVVLEELEDEKNPSLYRAEVAMEEISIGLGQIDVEILQAIKGQLGLITVAQLSILENLKEVEAAYSDLLKVIAPDIVAPLSSRKKSKKIKLF